MDSLVTTDWLRAELPADDLVVLDCTVFLGRSESGGFHSESGRAKWADGHIPGAGFADLTVDLVDATSPNSYALPEPEVFAAAMGALGVGDSSRVVLYDDNRSMWAARVWWMLRWIGFDNAALLDGGMQAWRAEGGPLSTEVPTPVAQSLGVAIRPSTVAHKADVLAAIDDGATCIIDALPHAMYSGEVNVYARPGHIPTASNTSAASLIDDQTGCFLPDEELRTKFTADPTKRAINYCGGGIAASANAFVMTRLGYTDVGVYTASLQEWANDPATPLVL
jgi:thiosulfate/3-mercaptopyruvate sulfurtransferase